MLNYIPVETTDADMDGWKGLQVQLLLLLTAPEALSLVFYLFI